MNYNVANMDEVVDWFEIIDMFEVVDELIRGVDFDRVEVCNRVRTVDNQEPLNILLIQLSVFKEHCEPVRSFSNIISVSRFDSFSNFSYNQYVQIKR